MTEALYGPRGFFRTQAPADHFRTSVHVGPAGAFARSVRRLAQKHRLDAVVDLGAGRGELLTTLHALDPDLTLTGVEIVDRPEGLPAAIEWTDQVPETSNVLVIANEWLDNVPLDVVEVDSRGVARIVEVDIETGEERLGAPVAGEDLAWLTRWWPLQTTTSSSRADPALAEPAPGTRAEIGRTRDEAWAGVVRRIRGGLLLAIDYGHRRTERPPAGTLTAYRRGRVVRPVPDGTCDLTAHVAVDAVAAAGVAAGAVDCSLTRQGDALRALGVDPARPPLTLARSDPKAYLTALSASAEASELVAPGGLGDYHWLRQSIRDPHPHPHLGPHPGQ